MFSVFSHAVKPRSFTHRLAAHVFKFYHSFPLNTFHFIGQIFKFWYPKSGTVLRRSLNAELSGIGTFMPYL